MAILQSSVGRENLSRSEGHAEFMPACLLSEFAKSIGRGSM